jgi:hypothetical protein
MTVFIKRSLPLIFALIASVEFCRADVPSGVFSFFFDTNTPVYDLTGSLQFDQTMSGAGGSELGLSYGINVTQDERGFITGSGMTAVAAGTDFVAAEYSAKGKISTRDGTTRVTLTVRLTGEDVFGGLLTPFRITVQYVLTLNPETGLLEGTARGTGRFGGLGSTRIRSDVSVPVPAGAGGSWTLIMNVVAFDRLSGTALVVLPNGRVLNFNLRGTYNSSTDQSNIRLSGTGVSRGNSLRLMFDSETLFLQGKMFGQTILF